MHRRYISERDEMESRDDRQRPAEGTARHGGARITGTALALGGSLWLSLSGPGRPSKGKRWRASVIYA